jgi:serine/threonine protein kinase
MPDNDFEPEARGTFVGTPLYVSPEMLEDNLALPASDLWALGVMIYNMHTGAMPFDGGSQSVIFDKILAREIAWPNDIHPMVAALVDNLL